MSTGPADVGLQIITIYIFSFSYLLSRIVRMYVLANIWDRSTWHDFAVLNGRVRDFICDTYSRSFYICWKYGASRSFVATAVPSGKTWHIQYGMFLRSIKLVWTAAPGV